MITICPINPLEFYFTPIQELYNAGINSVYYYYIQYVRKEDWRYLELSLYLLRSLKGYLDKIIPKEFVVNVLSAIPTIARENIQEGTKYVMIECFNFIGSYPSFVDQNPQLFTSIFETLIKLINVPSV